MVAVDGRTHTTLRQRYADVRSVTEELARPLSAEDQSIQSMPDASPTKWHRAHTTWFFETFVLVPHDPGYEAFHPRFGYLFNSYYESVGERWARAQRGLLSRPGVAEIGDYRRHVDAAMVGLLGRDPDGPLAGLIELGLHHEQQHQELLLMDVKHLLGLNPMLPAYREVVDPEVVTPGPDRWIGHPGGLVEIGARGDEFAFDNESPRHKVHLEPFELATRPVSCGEWAAFVDDGGYDRPELWLSAGWAAVQTEGWAAPLYWRHHDGGAREVFTLGGPRPLVAHEPVCHVSYYEADAYARWAGARLPTEPEWEAIAAAAPATSRPFDLRALHPRGVADGGGVHLGEVWEWTASAYLPYPGFRPAPGAVGEYNGKFMVDQHVLRGGSCASPPGHVRATYRNFFPPSARWPFTGLRLARDLGGR